MTRVPALSVRLVLAVVETVERAGVSRTRFLRLAKFDPQRFEAAEGRVTPAEFSRLCELALDLSGDPSLGLQEGETMTGASFSVVAPLIAHSSSLRQGLQTLLQVHKLVSDQLRYQLIEEEQYVTLRCTSMEGVSAPVCRFMAEVEMTSFCRMIRYFSGGARPARVNFEYPAPAYREAYARTFNGAESFDQPFTGVMFDRVLMDAPSLFKDDDLCSALRAQAERRISRFTQHSSYVDRVRDFIVRQRAPSRVDMSTVARALSLSARSLRRRLAAERTTYQALATDVVTSMAERLLLVERRTIQETAYALGYADSGAFHRAFKRWTGMTPSAFLTQREG